MRIYLRFCELVGVRWLYCFVAGSVQEVAMPASGDADSAKGWTREEIAERQESARYFVWANLVRTLFHVPIITFAFLYDSEWIGWIYAFLASLQLVMIVVESYKMGLSKLLIPDDNGVSEVSRHIPANFWEGYFRPKKWETEKFYERVGIRFFQMLTTSFINWARLSKEQKARGEKVEFVKKRSAVDLVRFENGSRVGELVHLVMAGLDMVPVFLAIGHSAGVGWLAYFLWMVYGDFWLVMLQRYNRMRIWKLVVRSRATLEKAQS